MPVREGNKRDQIEFQRLFKLVGVSRNRFAKALGINNKTLNPYLDGERCPPRVYVLAARVICLCLGHAIDIDRAEVQRYLGRPPGRPRHLGRKG